MTIDWDVKDSTLEIRYGQEPIMCLALNECAHITPGPLSIKHIMAWDIVRMPFAQIHDMNSWTRSGKSTGQEIIYLYHQDTRYSMSFKLTLINPWHLELEITTSAAGFLRITWHTPSEELWQGFGEHTHSIRPPAQFDSWVEEGPVGLGWLSGWLKKAPFVPFPKGPYPSYASMPLWLSSAGYSAWFTSFERIRWNLTHTKRQATIWSTMTTLHIITGQTPKDIFSRQFSVLGPPASVPSWALAPWNDSIRGQARATRLAHFLRSHRIPSSVIWIEDWMGSNENRRRFWMRPLKHTVDTELYPHLPQLARTLHEQGFRLLGYFCPEITYGTDLYRQALNDDILVKDSKAEVMAINILGIRHGQIDVTHENAMAWTHRYLLSPALALGFDGWMVDFGEYLPLEAQLADGTSGHISHNRYPLLWQKIHRAFWEQQRPDGNFVFFVRSGWIGSHLLAPVIWGGDSDTDFSEADGLPTVIPEALSAQISGFFYWATDIGGYMTFGLTRPRSRALFLRWLEVASLLPVMRTHHGTAAPRNWHFDSDAETLAIYAQYARLHTSLYPYFYHLSKVATDQGLPLIRPMYLEFPADRICWGLDRQFMLGEGILVAPVLTRKSSHHRFYLPEGRWRCWWSGEIIEGPKWVERSVPLDRLPLFIRHPFVVPLLEGVPLTDSVPTEDTFSSPSERGSWQMEGIVDSLARITTGPGVDLHQALDYLALYVFVSKTSWQQQIALPDGGILDLQYQPLSKEARPGPLLSPPHFASHFPKHYTFAKAITVAPDMTETIQLTEGILTLHPSADSRRRQYIVRWG